MPSHFPTSIWPEPGAWATRHPDEFGCDGETAAIAHWLDETRGRLMVQTFPGRFSNAEFSAAFDHFDKRLEACAELEAPLGLVVDLRFARVGTATQRRRIAKTFERSQLAAAHLIKGQAYVVKNPLQRGALTATLWLASPSWPIEVFTDRLAAVVWVSTQMEKAVSRPVG